MSRGLAALCVQGISGLLLLFVALGFSGVAVALGVLVGSQFSNPVVMEASVSVAAVLLGVPFGRSIHRFFPLKASGDPQLWRGVLFAIAAAGFAVLTLPLWALGASLTNKNEGIAFIMMLGRLPVLLCTAVCCSLVLPLTHLSIRATAGHGLLAPTNGTGFVLFLRRFASALDTAAIGTLLAGTSGKTRLAFLVSPTAVARSLDPIVLGWAGLRPGRPVASIPVYLRGSDRAWRTEVERLASAATVVLVDVEGLSLSMRMELELLAERGLSSRTILLHRGDASLAEARAIVPDAVSLRYDLSWFQALPRILLVGLLSAVCIYVPLSLDRVDEAIVREATFAGGIVFTLLFGARPSVTRESSKRLSRIIKARGATTPSG
jgi:hypothetical protein